MEFKRYNLLRQSQHHYDFLPSEFVALAAHRAKQHHKRMEQVSRSWDRIIAAGLITGAAYLTGHVLWWALR